MFFMAKTTIVEHKFKQKEGKFIVTFLHFRIVVHHLFLLEWNMKFDERL